MRRYFYKLSVTQILNPSLPFPRNQLPADGPGGQEQRSHPSSRELRGSPPAHPAPDPHQPQQEVPLQACLHKFCSVFRTFMLFSTHCSSCPFARDALPRSPMPSPLLPPVRSHCHLLQGASPLQVLISLTKASGKGLHALCVHPPAETLLLSQLYINASDKCLSSPRLQPPQARACLSTWAPPLLS